MRGLGHIAHLCNLAKPTIGVITNVGQAHIGEVGSIEAIAEAKSELVKAIPDSGVVVLNADDERVVAMRILTKATVFTYGFSKVADVRAENLQLTSIGSYSFDLVYGGERIPASIPMLGEHNVLNALAAAAVGLAVGMEFNDIVRAMTNLKQVSNWRMEVHQLPGNVIIINDAYNANPESMTAALKTLIAIPAAGKTFAILGKMHELGDASDGIPNILSDDNCFVLGNRQKPMTQKKMDDLINLGLDGKFDHTNFRNYMRNKQLIDLTQVPEGIKLQILESYDEQANKKSSNLLNYFIANRLKNLTESIGDFT
jgi:UDP-N-acetylmuramyl pentapeptide synthase